MTQNSSPSSPRRPAPRFVRIVRAHPRLFLCAAIGVLVMIALSGMYTWLTRLLIGWDAGAVLYLGFTYQMMYRSDVHRIRRRAAMQDEGQMAMLVVTVGAAVASLIAIVAELGIHAQTATRPPAQLALALATIVLSWVMIHTIFALHYAHEFYDPDKGRRGGLVFPGKDEPDYWDFVYFSLVVGMTSQVSDVAVSSRLIRRTVTAHGVVSFFFNAALIALTVNIAASAL